MQFRAALVAVAAAQMLLGALASPLDPVERDIALNMEEQTEHLEQPFYEEASADDSMMSSCPRFLDEEIQEEEADEILEEADEIQQEADEIQEEDADDEIQEDADANLPLPNTDLRARRRS